MKANFNPDSKVGDRVLVHLYIHMHTMSQKRKTKNIRLKLIPLGMKRDCSNHMYIPKFFSHVAFIRIYDVITFGFYICMREKYISEDNSLAE